MAVVVQNYEMYSDKDHQTWNTLFKRQKSLHAENFSKVYLDGLERLQIDEQRIANLGAISERLQKITGWSVVPVDGLIAIKEFFYMLINKQYPVTIYIRKPTEIDFSEQPDIFHDICGHLPLLANESFVKFLSAFSIIALKYVRNERAVEMLGRMYWYTYEMGIIQENDAFKPYGGAIITSSEEIANSLRQATSKHRFDVDLIFKTPYNPFELQKEYFVISSFQELFASLEDMERKLIEHLLLPVDDLVIRKFSINASLGRNFNSVIGFLNDTQHKFKDAISFVAGQPDENFFDITNSLSKFESYVHYAADREKASYETIRNRIGQYGKTSGMINEVIAEYLKRDESIKVDKADVLITAGAQEAFAIIVSTICERNKDVVVVEDPSYIGVSSFAKVFNYQVDGVGVDSEGLDLIALKRKILEIQAAGKNLKLLYVIPDYQNPSGYSMPIGNRLKLLEMAQKYNFLIIEDSVYNSFTYVEKRIPTLKSLDRYNRVIYVGSFSKLLFPGLRIGIIVADQKLEDENGDVIPLVNEMSKVKAQLSNNTSGISQAVLAGILIDANFSLSDVNRAKYDCYREKRNQMMRALKEYIKDSGRWAKEVDWNEPEGGFFLKMTVPFDVESSDVVECGSLFKVLFCPMRYFYLRTGGEREIRLTYSNLTKTQIDEGVKRLADYLRYRISSLDCDDSNSMSKRDQSVSEMVR